MISMSPVCVYIYIVCQYVLYVPCATRNVKMAESHPDTAYNQAFARLLRLTIRYRSLRRKTEPLGLARFGPLVVHMSYDKAGLELGLD